MIKETAKYTLGFTSGIISMLILLMGFEEYTTIDLMIFNKIWIPLTLITGVFFISSIVILTMWEEINSETK